jgi:hypothetical protein
VESPQGPEAMWTLLQKSDRRKLLLQLCGHTAFGRDLEPETGGEADTP